MNISHTNRWLTYSRYSLWTNSNGPQQTVKLPEGNHSGSHWRLIHDFFSMEQRLKSPARLAQAFSTLKISINFAIQGTSRCIWPGSPPSLAHLVRWAATALLCPRWSPRNWGKNRTRHHLRWGALDVPENIGRENWKTLKNPMVYPFIMVYRGKSSFPFISRIDTTIFRWQFLFSNTHSFCWLSSYDASQYAKLAKCYSLRPGL